ncbi:hypothetical protein ACH4E5_41240 [Streptomyces afghaniensis]|uniref:hypothetical protein n=1 Tax=Streptomyces afghaniensis TaxID=66865 RepID=UPI0037937F55
MTNPDRLQPDRINHVDVLILEANVVIEVSYEGKMLPATAAQKVEQIARITMTGIKPSFRHRLLGLFEI